MARNGAQAVQAVLQPPLSRLGVAPLGILLAAILGAACSAPSGSAPLSSTNASAQRASVDVAKTLTPTGPVRGMTLEAQQLTPRRGLLGSLPTGSEPDSRDRSGYSASDAAANPAAAPPRTHEVFAFAPYWTLPDEKSFDLSSISTVAYFGVDVQGDGSLVRTGSGWSGFQSQALTDLVARAHAANTRAVLVVKTFDPAALHGLASDPTAADRLAGQLKDVIRSQGMDGANFDFEGGDGADRADFSAFLTKVAQSLHGVDPHWQVTVDTYASAALDATGMINVAAIAPAVDAFFVMAYDMNSRTAPSPTAPLAGRDWNDTRAIDSYLAVVPGTKVLLGIPFYGYQWPTSDGSPQAQSTGGAQPVSYGQLAAQRPPVQWDAADGVPWTAYQDSSGQWWQAYFEDPQSVALKAQLADHLGIAGVGVWALGMEGGDSGMMSALLGLSAALKAPYMSGWTGTTRGIDFVPASPARPAFSAPDRPAPAAGPRTRTAPAPRPPVPASSGAPAPPPAAGPPVPVPTSTPSSTPTPSPTPPPTPMPTPTPSPTPSPTPTPSSPPPSQQPLKFEAESLAVWGTAPHVVQHGAMWSGGGQVLAQATAPGQQLSLQVQVPAGSYAVLVDPTLGPGYGSWQLLVDGRPLGGFNGYSSALASPDAGTQMGSMTLPAGSHTLTLAVTGKDARSSGYAFGIDFVELVPSA